jgi:hypothetical protein
MTVGPGITPGLLTLLSGTAEAVLPSSARGLCALRAITAGGELHPALRTFFAAGMFGGAAFLSHISDMRMTPFG